MNWLLGVILFMLTKREFVDGTSPFYEDSPNLTPKNDDFVTAAIALTQLKQFFKSDGDCLLAIQDVIGSYKNVSGGFINTFLDLKISSKCGSKFCSNVHLQKPENCESCENLVDVSNVQCTSESIVERVFFSGGFTNIKAPESDQIILNVAKKATKYLYSFFDTSKPCPLHLVSVVRAKQQTVMGFNYELEMKVETNGADFDCEHVVKICENVRVHEPIAEFCPHQEPSCVVPVRLDDFNCITVNTVYEQSPLVGGFTVRDIDEEIISIGKGVMDQMANTFGLKNHCQLKLENVLQAQSQVVAGTNFIMDLEFSTHGIHCPTEYKICYNVKIFRPLPYQCQEDQCLSLTQSEDTICVPIDKREINKSQLLGEEAAKFFYHLFDTNRACQIHVNDAQIIENVGASYHIEFQLETKESKGGCKAAKKNCKNVRVRSLKPELCPHRSPTCIVPEQLDDVECSDV